MAVYPEEPRGANGVSRNLIALVFRKKLGYNLTMTPEGGSEIRKETRTFRSRPTAASGIDSLAIVGFVWHATGTELNGTSTLNKAKQKTIDFLLRLNDLKRNEITQNYDYLMPTSLIDEPSALDRWRAFESDEELNAKITGTIERLRTGDDILPEDHDILWGVAEWAQKITIAAERESRARKIQWP